MLILASCAGSPPPAPADPGRGLLVADEAPPPGAVLYERPTWLVGETFRLVQADVNAATFTVEKVTDDAYWVRGPGGLVMRRTLDFGTLGEWDGDQPVRTLTPVDIRFHWPLWVGKQWRCEFVDQARGGRPLRVEAIYRVEELDTVTVYAGTFEALRIERTLKLLDGAPEVLARTQLIWYAPSIGNEVRQVLGDLEIQLAEHKRP